MLRRALLALATLAIPAACAQAPRVPPGAAPADNEVVVSAAGVTPTATGYSVGLVLRNTGAADAVGIEISLELLSEAGAVVGRASERLAYCPGGQDCLWGSSFTGDVAAGETVAGARGRAVAARWEPASRSTPFVVVVRRPDGAVAGRAPPNGTVYVVLLVDGAPRAGVFRRTSTEENFVVPADLLPVVAGEVIRAVFYDEAAPVGD